MTQLRLLILLMISFLNIATSVAQDNEQGNISNLALDKSITYGKLKNGLTYYIKPTENESSKIYMRLYLKVVHLFFQRRYLAKTLKLKR